MFLWKVVGFIIVFEDISIGGPSSIYYKSLPNAIGDLLFLRASSSKSHRYSCLEAI